MVSWLKHADFFDNLIRHWMDHREYLYVESSLYGWMFDSKGAGISLSPKYNLLGHSRNNPLSISKDIPRPHYKTHSHGASIALPNRQHGRAKLDVKLLQIPAPGATVTAPTAGSDGLLRDGWMTCSRVRKRGH